MHPANKLENLRRRVDIARNAPGVTCAASRHLHEIACELDELGDSGSLINEPSHCAESMYAVLEELWKLRAKQGRGK